MSSKPIVILILLLSTCVLFDSCIKEETKEIIKPLENYSDSFHLIPEKITILSDVPNAFIGRVSSIIMKDDKYYILDTYKTNSLLIFSQDGSLIHRSTRGRGPGELIFPFSLFIKDETLFVSDRNLLHSYTTSGKFLSSSTLPKGSIARNYGFLPNGNIITYGSSKPLNYKKQEDSVNQSFYRYHIYEDMTMKEIDYFIETPVELAPLECDKPLADYKDHFLLLSQPENNIYLYDQNGLQVKYVVDFGDYNFTDDDKNSGKEHLTYLIMQKQRLGILDNIFEQEGFILFSYLGWNNGLNEHVIYSKNSKQAANFNDVLRESNMPQMAIVGNSGNSLICCFDPGYFETSELESMVSAGIIKEELAISKNIVIYLIKIVEN